jgi:hypothetical protein
MTTPDRRGEYLASLNPAERKKHKVLEGLLRYFPDACAYVAYVSHVANEQHNPGEPMHWSREKSIGVGNEIVRHLMDRENIDSDGLRHRGKAAWRALELLQREIEADLPATAGNTVSKPEAPPAYRRILIVVTFVM